MKRSIYWHIQSAGRYITDPPAALVLHEARRGGTRKHFNPSDASLQRLINLSQNGVSVEINDGILTAYGFVRLNSND